MNQEYRETKGEKVQDLEQIPGVTAEQARDICSHSPSESESQLRLAPYRAIVEAQSDLISRSLPDYTLTFVNESYCRHFKKTREMLIGGCFLDLLAEEERPAVIASIESISVQKPLASHEERIISDNGEITWVEWSNRGIFDGQGRLVELQSVGRDITRRKQAENQLRLAMDRLEVRVKERTIELEKANQMLSEEITRHKMVEKALRESEEKFRKLAETAPALIFVLQGNKLSYVNTSMELATGFSREECQQGNFWDYVHPDFRQLTRERGLARLRGEDVPKRYEFKIIGKQGQEIWLDYSADLIEFGGEPAILAAAYDITERKEYEKKFAYLSFHDKLTGLYNRAFFEEELRRLNTQRQLPLSLIIGDVNGLKLVNDAFGHAAGDRLLSQVADILRASCREEDIIARWGGDEFALLLPKTGEKEAVTICERIKQFCCNKPVSESPPINISISLGHASKDNPGILRQEMLKEAEDRMYRNKLLENQSTRRSFINSLEKTLWTRSHETQEHCQRLRDIAVQIGMLVNLDDSEIDNLNLAATLHDIGKIAIPNTILDKPEKLTAEEWESIKKHPEIGYRIALTSSELAPIAEAILAHHERWDGNGYPLKLKKEEIPLISRIISIADAFDVMLCGRPYKKALERQKVLDEIKRCSGTQFDPELAHIFLSFASSNFFKLSH